MEVLEEIDEHAAAPMLPSSVVVAVNGSRNSKAVLKWTLQKFLMEERILFKLLHVRAPITTIPTPVGNYPISQVRDEILVAYKKEMEEKTQKMLLPYIQMFTENKVKVEVLVVEADNVADGITREVSKLKHTKLVIGASSSFRIKWKLKGKDIASSISESTPSCCTTYVIKNGKLSSVRLPNLEIGGLKDDNSDDHTSTTSFSSEDFSSQIDGTNKESTASSSNFSCPVTVQRFPVTVQRFPDLSTRNKDYFRPRSASVDVCYSRADDCCSKVLDDGLSSIARISSFRSLQMDPDSWASGEASNSELPILSSSESKVDINFELEKLRIELRHARGMYVVAQNETINAFRHVSNLNKRRTEEALKLQEICLKENQAIESARQEKEKYKGAKREAKFLKEYAEREASERKVAEHRAAHEAVEKQKLEQALKSPFEPYNRFTWNEIVSATSSFSDDLKIGMGAYGTVYKCTLKHVTAAVKVLHSKEGRHTKEFQQELDILSRIRHPHLLILLGACPDHSCLVYEYMENGSLEEKLLKNNGTLPIPWFGRYRIAWEIASALVFLHNAKPRPIVHRDLKPANILLDQNLVSKIGDVGLSTLLPSINSSQPTISNISGLVGTLCYIDPEYQRSGAISPKSDVYAFGMVILQLLTAKPALALAHLVENALESGFLMEILDSKAGSWPIKETRELAVLGLRCAEMKQIDRPDLATEVLTVLERLKRIADIASDSTPSVPPATPKDFICPLLKEVMDDPCVASDGYTYDRKAIEVWLKENDKSPTTCLPLLDKSLIPNYSLLSAIIEWKSCNK